MLKEKDKLISIIIVGYNAGKHLSDCLNSIYKQTYENFEVIFVDNGSCDDTALILRAFPSVIVINNYKNKGFCFANNQGIKRGRGWYFLTLNSDIILDKNFLAEMMEAISVNNAGLFGAKILSKDGKVIDSTGLELTYFYRFFDRGSGEIDSGQYDSRHNIFGPCAAAALYKKEMLEDIKYDGEYFDNDFFFLLEDFDLAWRALNKGWKAIFVPGAVCYHARNSTNFERKFRQYLSYRNRFFLLLKNKKVDLKYSIVFIFYDIPRTIYFLFTNRYMLGAIFDIMMNMRKILKKRALIYGNNARTAA